MSWASDVVSRYGPVATGLAIGTAAKHGLAIQDGKAFTWRSLLVDLLLLGFLGLVAVTVSEYFTLTGNAKVLAGAMAAVSSDRIVRLIRQRFEQRVAAQVDRLPTAALARLIGGELPATTPELRDLLDRIDEADRAPPERTS